jgi:amino acid transporter
MNFVPFTRIFTIATAAVVCFGLIVPLALQRHQTVVVIGVSVLFVLYLIANIILWRRMNRRA